MSAKSVLYDKSSITQVGL